MRLERAVFFLYLLTTVFLFTVYRLHEFLGTLATGFNHHAGMGGTFFDDSSKAGVSATAHTFQTQRQAAAAQEAALQKLQQRHHIAGLHCQNAQVKDGVPLDHSVEEMIYWRDIPSDAQYSSPFHDPMVERYLTFEVDEGGFNNIRMAMEVAVTLSVAMGRTLVLPPAEEVYLLHDVGQQEGGTSSRKNQLGLEDMYHFTSVSNEHQVAGGGFKVISFQQFLEKEAMTGRLKDSQTGHVTFPPYNLTNWDGLISNIKVSAKFGLGEELWNWMRRATTPIEMESTECILAFPKDANDLDFGQRITGYLAGVFQHDADSVRSVTAAVPQESWRGRVASFSSNPLPVNASVAQRLAEAVADRQKVCFYDASLQEANVFHLTGSYDAGNRLLLPFYTFLFFEDWHHDLWMKRFVRDHLRYNDEIQCAAARVVAAVRQAALQHGDPNGEFDSMHIRRGDFNTQFLDVAISAEDIYANNTRFMLREGRTVFVATDEKNKTFFDPLSRHYNVQFLSDYLDLIDGVNSNYYGMIDQLVAAKGDTFVGSYYSTFSAYINRLRGYHAQKARAPGFESGIINSYYYTPDGLGRVRSIMRSYRSIEPPFWAQEFAAGWREIDMDVAEKAATLQSER